MADFSLDISSVSNHITLMKRSPATLASRQVPEPRAVVGQLARIRELANHFIESELARRGVVGIVPAHGAVLSFLFAQSAPVPIKDVVRHVGRVKSTVTQVLAGLERAGYLTKAASPDDNRVVHVALTEQGCAIREVFVEISEALEAKIYGTMPLADRQRLMQALALLETNLRH